MDCNSYSYINYGSKTNLIASCNDGFITFSYEVNYFQEHYFIVSDIDTDTYEVFPLNLKDLPFDKAYSLAFENARKLYNSLVPEKEIIPFT